MKLVTGNSNRALALAVADYLELPLTDCTVKRFADKDNLADRAKAFQDREKLNQVWATKYGKDDKGNTKSLDEEVTKSVGGNKKI